MAKIKRVLVTGSSGRAGRTVAAELAANGFSVLGLDVQEYPGSSWEFVSGDIRDLVDLRAKIQGVQAVCHTAAIPKDTGEAEKIFDLNMKGTFNVLEAARSSGVRRVVFASSVVVYGISGKGPLPRHLPIDEDHPCLPATTYAATKLMGEMLCRSYTLRHGMATVCLRLGNFTLREKVFSVKNDRGELWTNLLGAKLVSEDLAQAFRLGVESDIEHGVYNITTRYRYTKEGEVDRGEAVARAAAELGIPRVSPEVIEGASSFSTGKAERELGYSPSC